MDRWRTELPTWLDPLVPKRILITKMLQTHGVGGWGF